MALLTTINGVPLYSTVGEAVAWGASRGLTGTHTHEYQGQIGYMGGATHTQATANPGADADQDFSPNNAAPTIPTMNSSAGGGTGGY
tara:strand:+ start:894 stop:1154 length:261 start_codon:yes stop_codon:yes gene_type:complete